MPKAEAQEGVPVGKSSTCSYIPQPWYLTLCSLVCWSFFFPFTGYKRLEQAGKKCSHHTKHVTSSSQWHTLHPLWCFSLLLCPHFQSTIYSSPPSLQTSREHHCIKVGTGSSVPLAKRPPVCVPCQQFLWPQQSEADLKWGCFFELLNCSPFPGCALPKIFNCICCPEWMVTHMYTCPIHLN